MFKNFVTSLFGSQSQSSSADTDTDLNTNTMDEEQEQIEAMDVEDGEFVDETGIVVEQSESEENYNSGNGHDGQEMGLVDVDVEAGGEEVVVVGGDGDELLDQEQEVVTEEVVEVSAEDVGGPDYISAGFDNDSSNDNADMDEDGTTDDGEVEGDDPDYSFENEAEKENEARDDNEIQQELDDDDGDYMSMEITRRRVSHEKDGNCYCGKDRNLNILELLCASCSRWYHESCITIQTGKTLPFMLNYVFICKNCSSFGLESFKKQQTQISQLCLTALANLTQISAKDGSNRTKFSRDRDIFPYFEQHWEGLRSRNSTNSYQAVTKALIKDVDNLFTYEDVEDDPDTPYFGLICQDLTTLRPNYDALIKSGHLKITDFQSSGAYPRRGGRRRNAGSDITFTGNLAKKSKGDFISKSKMSCFPLDHPYNKDDFKYYLAESDINAPHRQEFDEHSDYSKTIPSWLYRVLTPYNVLLALHDRAPQLKVSDDRLSVTGEKGYCMIRATHGVARGTYYWEAKITDFPEGAACRLGFAQQFANIQAPLGWDKYGYSWRSLHGTKFHQAKGKTYRKINYGVDDVLGFMIHMPEDPSRPYIPDSYKDKPLIKVKSHLYYEVKDEQTEIEKTEKNHKGSKILFFKNGVCHGVAFEDIYDGNYFPALSLFHGLSISVNFGPNFEQAPIDSPFEYKPMSARAEESIIERTLADMLYLTENESKLTLDNVPSFMSHNQ